MAGKNADGFTKSAQKKKFIRHRDIKLKDSELKKESKIVKGMCEGVCQKCREKVQWRFKYDKYKPLKHPATCQGCKNKTVTKAYRTLCDPCASVKNICSSCCLPETEETNNSMEVEEQKDVVEISTSTKPTIIKSNEKKQDIIKSDNNDDDEDEEDDEEEDCEEEEDEGGGEEQDNDDDELNDNNINDTASVKTDNNNNNMMDTIWDERKFHNMANKKYSKTRVVGSENEYQTY